VKKSGTLSRRDSVRQSMGAGVAVTAIVGRMSAHAGQQITCKEIMEDAGIKPVHSNDMLRPTAEDFQRGTVHIPQNVVPLPGLQA